MALVYYFKLFYWNEVVNTIELKFSSFFFIIIIIPYSNKFSDNKKFLNTFNLVRIVIFIKQIQLKKNLIFQQIAT